MVQTNLAEMTITRRTSLQLMTGSAAVLSLPAFASAESPESQKRTGMGLVIYDCSIRRGWMRRSNPKFDLFEPLTFLKHCQRLGAGGMQANLGVLNAEQITQLRDFADEHKLFIDGIVAAPKDSDDRGRFAQEIETARHVGVQAVRTVIMPGRRYERFKTLAEFREYERRGRKMLELAAPIVEKHRIPLAVENHKDQRIDERLELFKHLDCEFIGACVDTGNSFALLDDPYGAIEALAPHAFTVHLKDQALQPSDDGFLLGDIPLGQGSFDLARMVAILKKAKPQIRFALELITRDALNVPCLTDEYFATMSQVSASDLARTLRFVREHRTNLQEVSRLSPEQQLNLEDANIAMSLQFARAKLAL